MDTAGLGRDLLVAAAGEYGPQPVGGAGVRFEALRLAAEVRAVQTMDSGFASLFVGEVTASVREGQGGATVTCVGFAKDMESAVRDAIGQWALGVLPVLAQWRGVHSCLSSSSPFETRGGRFTLLAGPTIEKGRPDGAASPESPGEFAGHPLESLLRGRPLGPRVHWLELYANKSADGTVEATCRLNNRNWSAGRAALVGVARGWEASQEPLRSCRQFLMLVPEGGNREELSPPSFWQKLRSRA